MLKFIICLVAVGVTLGAIECLGIYVWNNWLENMERGKNE